MTMTPSPKFPLKALAGLACLAVAAAIGFGLWKAANPPAAPFQGQVDARVIDVAPKIAGRIGKVFVKEGDLVDADEVLVEIEIPELAAKLAQVKAQKEAADARMRLVEEGVRSEQIDAAKAQYERALSAQTLAQKTFSRIDSLYKDGLVSAQKHDEARAALDNAANLTQAAKSTYEMAVTGARTDEKRAAQALAEQAAQGVAEVASLASEAHVRAPRAGEVSRIVLHAGEVAPSGFPLVTLIDHADKWVVFNIREDELAGIRVGATMMADIPALNLKGVALNVYWISPRADYATWRSTRQSSGYDVRTFEVRARPAQPLSDLRPGMSVLVPRS